MGLQLHDKTKQPSGMIHDRPRKRSHRTKSL